MFASKHTQPSLSEWLRRSVLNQEEAIKIISCTVRRKIYGWVDKNRPLVFLFLGSSGVGKTELAKQLAYFIHEDRPGAFIRLDMSEYQEKHAVSKFIGSPPGYVGRDDDSGLLTSKLKYNSNAVVLFDEIEKAHPNVLTVLLQLFDEGRITSGEGKTVECKDAIFIMTSNLAADEISEHVSYLRTEANISLLKSSDEPPEVSISRDFKKNIVTPLLKRHFRRDEFLGRINELVFFLPFTEAGVHKLVIRELEFWAKKAKENHDILLTWKNNVVSALAKGYDVRYGARSIKFEVERQIINLLAAAQELKFVEANCSVLLVTNASESNLPETNSSESNLPETNSSESNLPETNSSESNLPEKNSSESNLPETNSSESNLPETNSSESNLPETNSSESNLSETNLSNSNSSETNFEELIKLRVKKMEENDFSEVNVQWNLL